MFKQISRTSQIILSLTLSVVVFIGLILFSFKVYRNLNDSFDSVEHTYTVISEVESLRYHLTQAELNEGEYNVSNSGGYLHNFIVSYQMVQKKLQRLDSLTKDEVSQQKKLETLNELVNQREKIFLENINKQTAIKLSSQDSTAIHHQEVALRKKITAVIDNITNAENQSLQVKKEQVSKQRTLTYYLDLFAGMGALILAGITVMILVKDHKTRKKAEEELISLNANKDKFFSIVSHDLRGPASNIVQLSQFMLDPDDTMDNQMRREMAEHLHFSAQKLYKLLENLLSWAKLQMNRVEFKPVQIDLHKLATENISQVATVAAGKQITIFNEIPDWTTAYADEKMCEAVIRNLLLNAIKFTNAGGQIQVRATDKNNFVEISVKDSGVGMKKENVERLFNLGTHFSSKGTANEPGSGLGLILCKEFVEKNNGKISVESELGKGSIFTFSLPKTGFVVKW